MGDPPIEKLLSQRYVTATYKKIPEIPHDIPAKAITRIPQRKKIPKKAQAKAKENEKRTPSLTKHTQQNN
jgi:hypothetical protein